METVLNPAPKLLAVPLQLDLSAFFSGEGCLDSLTGFFSSGIFLTPETRQVCEEKQPFDWTVDLDHFLIGDPLNCNYNLAII
jgi:hypothetical protein